MEEKSCRLVFKGDIAAGAVAGEVKKRLCSLLNADISRIERLFAEGVTILKKGITESEAQRLKAVFDNTGAIAFIEPALEESPATIAEKTDDQLFCCPKCGTEQENSSTCVRCGVVFAKIKDGAAGRTPAQGREAWLPPPVKPVSITSPGVRVGGWLLFFCLVLSVFSPLATLVAFLKTYKETSLFFPRFPRLMVIIDIDVLLSLCLMTFSIYAGVWLWRVRPGAVSMAKRYLFCFLGYQAIASVLPFFAGLPPEANAAMLSGVGKDFFKGVVFFAVWYAYLSCSKRVRETYGL